MPIFLKLMLLIGFIVLGLWAALAYSTWRYIQSLREWRQYE